MAPRFRSSAAGRHISIEPATRPTRIRNATCIPSSLKLPSICLLNLSVEPNRGEVLIDKVAGTDFPALDIRPVRNGPIPEGERQFVRLGVDDVFLEFAH